MSNRKPIVEDSGIILPPQPSAPSAIEGALYNSSVDHRLHTVLNAIDRKLFSDADVIPVANGGTNNGSLPVTGGTVYYADGTKVVGLSNGSSGQVLTSAGGTSAPTWTTPSTSTSGIATKTSNYTTTGSDGTILVDASTGSFTITLIAASSVSGQTFKIKRIDNTPSNTVTISGTISGAANWILYTIDDAIEFQSDGTNYTLLSHNSITDWINAGALAWTSTAAYTFTIASSTVTIGAIYSNNGQTFVMSQSIAATTSITAGGTGAPTSSGTLTLVSGTGPATIAFSAVASSVPVKGTNTENFWWRRVGTNVEYRYEYKQTAAGTAGTGDYLPRLPSFLTADVTKITAYTGPVVPLNSIWGSTNTTGFFSLQANSTTVLMGPPTIYNQNYLRLLGIYSNTSSVNNDGSMGSALSPLTSTTFVLAASGSYPVLGWKA